jgi:hypothetical protein
MPDVAVRSSDIGIALSTAPVATAAQISPAFLYDVDIGFSFFVEGFLRCTGRETYHVAPQRGRDLARLDLDQHV